MAVGKMLQGLDLYIHVRETMMLCRTVPTMDDSTSSQRRSKISGV